MKNQTQTLLQRKAKTITFPKDSVSIGLAETKARLENLHKKQPVFLRLAG